MAYMEPERVITTLTNEKILLRDLQTKFLEKYAEHGTIQRAAKECGINRTTVYQWAKHDAVYANMFAQARLQWADTIREAMIQRGMVGIQSYAISRGQLVLDASGQPVKLVKYSDALLALIARANIPEYRKLDADTQPEDAITEHSLVIPDMTRLRQETLDMLLEDLDRMDREDRERGTQVVSSVGITDASKELSEDEIIS